MAEYIEREAVFGWFCESADIGGCVDLPRNNGSCKKGYRHCTDGKELDEIPAADVRPVVRGRWIITTERFAPERICSSCKCRFPVSAGEGITEVLNFCSNCGADMRKDGDGE